MKAETWLARCAAELQHLYLTNPRSGVDDVPPDEWSLETAGEFIEAQRYRGLDPVQAARTFWRSNEGTARKEAAMDAWDLSMLEAEQGLPVGWGWALRRLPGAGLVCCIGSMYGAAANEGRLCGAMTKPHIPEQQQRTETYRGVKLLVIAQSQPNGRWTWAYVAGDYQGRLRGALLPTAEAALTQGLLAARARVGDGRLPNSDRREELPLVAAFNARPSWHTEKRIRSYGRHTLPTPSASNRSDAMFKAIFGFLGLMIALAVVVPLAKPYLGALWQSGQTTTRVRGSKTAGVDKPAVAQPASGAQKSMFGRTDDSWRQSKDRYKSAEERSDN